MGAWLCQPAEVMEPWQPTGLGMPPGTDTAVARRRPSTEGEEKTPFRTGAAATLDAPLRGLGGAPSAYERGLRVENREGKKQVGVFSHESAADAGFSGEKGKSRYLYQNPELADEE